jgi:hypothetical protein
MKTLVDELELIPVTAQETIGIEEEPPYVRRAQALGFTSIRVKSRPPTGITNLPYPEITDEAIRKLLLKKATEDFLAKIGKEHGYRNEEGYQVSTYSFYMKWKETPIDKYEGIPPDHVLTSVDKARNTTAFERFAIVTVEHVPDPLLIGITADKRRCLIDHWGQDLTPDEILSLLEE